ncbi:adenylate/guanylate cyclase domain-containing protein [Desulfovibrio ferrophilus]|uniref:Adenylate/guanylate cyclase n=1 Tax=Desulfovibrio ferrophilus TaxID=241368 RepID=A0A2Z6AYC3_9BACT|nr:adenylate/guanylate cyclase domain-containing protein [Desulfovibrio ferrophilus]BBD08249.1 adenylate/guanylate cyclase [Desulfovibrio ferrophilus]
MLDKRFKLSFRVNILILMVSLILLCGGVVTVVAYSGGKKSVQFMAEQLIAKHKDGIVVNALQYVQKAEGTLSVYQDMEAAGVFQNLSIVDRKLYFTKALRNSPEFSNFYYGDENGTFLMAKRMPDNSLSFCFLFRDEINAYSSWFHEEAKWGVKYPTDQTIIEAKAFDPRDRPWYLDSVMKGSITWSDLYIFSSDGQPGITCSIPTFDSSGRVTGVLGIDINVASLSEFMNRSSVLDSHAMIITEDGNIVGMTGKRGSNVFAVTENISGKNQTRPLNINDIQHNVFAKTWSSFLNAQSEGDTTVQQAALDFNFLGESYLAAVAPLPKDIPWKWDVAVVVNQDAFMGEARRTAMFTLGISLILVLTAVLAALFFSSKISKPIRQLSGSMGRIKDFDLEAVPPIQTMVKEVDEMIENYGQMVSGLRSFKKYVPANLVKRLITMGEEATIGGQTRELTVFFSDIADFTRLSESMQPQELVGHLSDYLSEFSQVITARKGTIDKYIGDSIMAFWGAPESIPNHAELACRAAIECRNLLRERAQSTNGKTRPAFPTRMGINTGEVTVGNIGSDDRMDYTVIGDNVNLASRLEGLNKYYDTGIIISESTYQAAKASIEVRPLDYVIVKGRTQPVRVYELLAMQGELGANEARLATLFGEGFNLYLQRQFADAQKCFAEIYQTNKTDKPAIIYHNRCRTFLETPPPQDWNGTFQMKSK